MSRIGPTLPSGYNWSDSDLKLEFYFNIIFEGTINGTPVTLGGDDTDTGRQITFVVGLVQGGNYD